MLKASITKILLFKWYFCNGINDIDYLDLTTSFYRIYYKYKTAFQGEQEGLQVYNT